MKLKFTSMLIVAAAAMPFFLSCSNPVDSSEHLVCGPGIIIPGVCIDGVKLGDSRERVDELLGEPSGVGWADGVYRAWRTYWYKPPGTEGSGFTIFFYYQGEDMPWGPADALIAHNPYDGKTPEGIGIGSTLDEVRAAYGEPDDIPEDITVDGTHRLQYTYCFNSVKFTIGMHDQLVIGFFIGFFEQIEQDTTYQCL